IYSFIAVAMLTGVGNGFGAGIVMTLGADFAPAVRRGEFLGIWRLMSDTGQVTGPALIGLLTGIGSLGLAAVVSGGIGFVGAVFMVAVMGEPLRRDAPLIEPVIVPPRVVEASEGGGPGP